MSKESNLTKEKKKGRLLLVICFILMMVLCGGLGYFIGTSDLVNPKEVKQDNEKTTKESKTDELKDVEVDEFMIALLDKLSTDDICGLLGYDYYTNDKVTVNDLSKKHVQEVMLYNLRKKGVTFMDNTTFSAEEAHEVIENVFGKDYNYVDESIEAHCPVINYNEQDKSYGVGIAGCGGACGPHTLKKLLSAKRSDNNIELTVGVLFGPKEYDTKLYSDYDRTNVVVDAADVADSDYDKGGKYKVTFKNEDGNYVFVSSEPIK